MLQLLYPTQPQLTTLNTERKTFRRVVHCLNKVSYSHFVPAVQLLFTPEPQPPPPSNPRTQPISWGLEMEMNAKARMICD